LYSDEQAILANWYNSLQSKGTLNWNITNDLCGQVGVTCDFSDSQRVTKLYCFWVNWHVLNVLIKFNSFSIFFYLRNLGSRQLNGTISTQLGNLVNLRTL